MKSNHSFVHWIKCQTLLWNSHQSQLLVEALSVTEIQICCWGASTSAPEHVRAKLTYECGCVLRCRYTSTFLHLSRLYVCTQMWTHLHFNVELVEYEVKEYNINKMCQVWRSKLIWKIWFFQLNKFTERFILMNINDWTVSLNWPRSPSTTFYVPSVCTCVWVMLSGMFIVVCITYAHRQNQLCWNMCM